MASDHIHYDPEKAMAVASYPLAFKMKDVQSFLGLCTYYYWRSIPCCAATQLPDEGQNPVYLEWRTSIGAWGTEDMPIDKTRACHFSSNARTEKDRDASNERLGAELARLHDSIKHVLTDESRATKPQKNYSTVKKGYFALIWVIIKQHPRLYGLPFKV